jgi:lysophospholipase L1-like esterase
MNNVRRRSVVFALLLSFSFLGLQLHHAPRIFLVGDSTMADKPLVDNPEHGWGQVLPMFFSRDIHIFNHAKNGRSTKSFIAEGRWNAVYDQLQPGDFVFIQFGHNDSKKEDSTRFAAPRPAYKENLRLFVQQAREKQAIPILLTPITRRDFDSTGRYTGTHGEYPAAMKEVASEEHVPLIDMFEKTKQLVSALGDEASKSFYLAGVKPQEFRTWHGKRDNTHFTRSGAIQMATLVVKGIKELHLPLEKYLIKTDAKKLVGTNKIVGLDYYFNNEWRAKKDTVERYHYIWEDTTNSGFSLLGSDIDRLGANLDTLQSAPTDSSLSRLSVYVIVDPDTPTETKDPHYISDGDAVVIERWVKNGGVLLLMANDKGNCEFEHLNKLSERFGIHFNEDCYHRVTGKEFDMGKCDKLPNHPIFKGIKKIYLKEICSLKLQKPAKIVLKEGKLVWMAEAHVGKGLVFAVDDPWLYNEYYDVRKLPSSFENGKAGRNLFQWLLKNSTMHMQ